MSDRSCLLCRHCEIVPSEGPWSEYTPGSDPYMRCTKGHWRLAADDYSRADVFKAFNTAVSCPDYMEEKP